MRFSLCVLVEMLDVLVRLVGLDWSMVLPSACAKRNHKREISVLASTYRGKEMKGGGNK